MDILGRIEVDMCHELIDSSIVDFLNGHICDANSVQSCLKSLEGRYGLAHFYSTSEGYGSLYHIRDIVMATPGINFLVPLVVLPTAGK